MSKLSEDMLAECPMCGGRAECLEDEEATNVTGTTRYSVSCRNLTCRTGQYGWDTRERAIAAWNRRSLHPGQRYTGADEGWQPIETAPKDGTTIWAAFREDIYPAFAPDRKDYERWNGVQVPLRHQGTTESGFDMGWSIRAPVGQGGFPDAWIAGWRLLPAPPAKGDATLDMGEEDA